MELGSDGVKDALDILAEQSNGRDGDDSDQSDQEGVFCQVLTFLTHEHVPDPQIQT